MGWKEILWAEFPSWGDKSERLRNAKKLGEETPSECSFTLLGSICISERSYSCCFCSNSEDKSSAIWVLPLLLGIMTLRYDRPPTGHPIGFAPLHAHFTDEEVEAQSQRGHTASQGESGATNSHRLAPDRRLYGAWTRVSWLLPAGPLTKHEMSSYSTTGVSYDKTALLHRAEAFGGIHFSAWLLFLD